MSEMLLESFFGGGALPPWASLEKLLLNLLDLKLIIFCWVWVCENCAVRVREVECSWGSYIVKEKDEDDTEQENEEGGAALGDF